MLFWNRTEKEECRLGRESVCATRSEARSEVRSEVQRFLAAKWRMVLQNSIDVANFAVALKAEIAQAIRFWSYSSVG